MQLLERDAALDSLVEYVEAARAGDSRVVLVSGEAGVGKTTLLEVLHKRFADARWLWGGCDGAFTPEPLGPLFDVASQVGGQLAEACREQAPRERLFRALRDELADADTLTVLVIEDLHWADEATLDLLRFLSRRLGHGTAMVLATYRDDGLAASHPLRTTLGELATERGTRRVAVPPLTKNAVHRLADGTGIEPAELFALTGGNPFLVSEVLDAGTTAVPPSASAAILARAARLTHAARDVLEAAAVIGMRVEVEILAKVGTPDTEAIDECLTAGALVSDGHAFRFRHELARRALEESIPAHRRTELHRQILDVLITTGVTDSARLAHHGDCIGAADVVLEHAPAAAARSSSFGGHTEALAQYERAVRYADAADVRTQARLWTSVADEACLIDRWEEATRALETSLALWEAADDRVRVGDTWRRLSVAMWRLCRGGEEQAAAQKAVDILEPLEPTVELAAAYSALAWFLQGSGRAEDALVLSKQALELAERLGAQAIVSRVLNVQACAAIGRGEDAFAQLERGRDIAVALRDATLIGSSFANLQDMAAGTYRLAQALRYYDEGIAYARDSEVDTFLSCLYAGQAHVLEKLGRWEEALALLVDVLGKRHVSPINRLWTLICLIRIQVRRGAPEAHGLLQEAVELAAAGLDAAYLIELRLAQVEAAWLAGDSAAAAESLDRAVALFASVNCYQQGMIAVWARRCGLGLHAEPADIPEMFGPPLRGDWRAAADGWLALGCHYEAALALLESSKETALREAVAMLDQLGATAVLVKAQSIMRKLGMQAIPRGRRPATRADPHGLTRRESEVLALIRDRKTNAEIASELFLSERTIDHHVSNVLRKMDVATRRAAAAKAAESEPLEVVAT